MADRNDDVLMKDASSEGTTTATSNKRTKLETAASSNETPSVDSNKPYALDEKQLKAIGYYDRNLLDDFKELLEKAIHNLGFNDWVKRVEYFKLLGAVEDRLERLSETPSAPPFDEYFTLDERTVPLSQLLLPPKSDDDHLSATVYGSVLQDDDDGNDTVMEFERNIQKDRAKQQFDESFVKKTSIKEDHETDDASNKENDPPIEALAKEDDPTIQVIREALDKRRVKPLFHAHFLPATFLGKQRSLRHVTAGESGKNEPFELDIYGDNLEKVVSKNGKGVGSIVDVGMASNWEFDYKQVAFAVKLVNTDATMLGEDVECTKLDAIPIKINPSDVSFDLLLTRPESRGVVRDIYHRFAEKSIRQPNGGSVAAITGSTGIGKSWTLFYALQQALLYDGATVLFFFQKRSYAVMYLRRNNKIYAWTSKSKIFADSNLFNRSDVLVLLDPREATREGPKFNSGHVKLLFADPNDSTALRKENVDFQAFLGPPLDSELRVILCRLDPLLMEQSVIEERKKNVGNLIRYILDDKKYQKRVTETDRAVEKCAENHALLKRALEEEGISKAKETIAGTLFQVLPTRPSDKMGYDGQGVEYRERVVMAVSENVRKAIVQVGREVMTLSYRSKSSW